MKELSLSYFEFLVPISNFFLSLTININIRNYFVIYIKKCRRWGLNPRPFGIEPKSTALDHSATSTSYYLYLNLR